MIKLDKNGLTAPSITTGSITLGDTAVLRGYPNGELNWNSSKVITLTDFSDFPTDIRFSEEST